jgi:hypothetical protein
MDPEAKDLTQLMAPLKGAGYRSKTNLNMNRYLIRDRSLQLSF